jgi:ferrous iron transport protein A
MPITIADPGTRRTIVRIAGSSKIRKHLEGLGFTEGVEVRIVSKTPSGVIVNIRESRVALGRDLANKVMV